VQDERDGYTAQGSFDVTMQSGPAELEGAISRCQAEIRRQAWPVTSRLRQWTAASQGGSSALRQFGTLHGGTQTLHYEVVPGSGSGQLGWLTGILHFNIDEDGTHRYELEYEL
jgi:hypothetical protein